MDHFIVIVTIGVIVLGVSNSVFCDLNFCRDKPKAPQILCTDNKCEIKAAVILPQNSKDYVVSLPEVVPLLEQAVRDAKRSNIIPEWLHVKLIEQDDRCEASYAQLAQIDTYRNSNDIHVIFGPMCEYCVATVSRIIKFYGTPLLTAGGFSEDFEKVKKGCNDEYYMLIRTGTLVFKGLSQFFKTIAQSYGWRKVAFLYDNGPNEVAGINTCPLMMQTLAKELRSVEGFQYKDGDLNLSTFNTSEFLKNNIGVNYGIIVMCASRKGIKDILLAAENLGDMVTRGEYIFFNIELINKAETPTKPWEFGNKSKGDFVDLKHPFRSVLTLTSLSENVLDQNNASLVRTKYNYLSGFYDAMMLYLTAVNMTIGNSLPKENMSLSGYEVLHRMCNISFKGLNGMVYMDDNGDRITEYSLLSYNPNRASYEVVANFRQNDHNFTFIKGKNIHWLNGGNVPPDTPTCGYDNSKCPTPVPYTFIIGVLITLIFILCLAVALLYRQHMERKIYSMCWKINWNEIDRVQEPEKSRMNLRAKNTSLMTLFSIAGDQTIIPIGYFKKNKVALKKILPLKHDLNRKQLIHLKQMLDLQHDHLTKFYGVCLDPTNCYVILEYCRKGSLMDFLQSEKYKMEWMVQISLIQDLVTGMQYLHNSEIKSHGSLSSRNCVIDDRLLLKITDFGLYCFTRCDDTSDSPDYWDKKLWTAPELLRMLGPPREGTQKGDVYSFGIIVHEIMHGKGPFYLGDNIKLSAFDIVESVKNCVPGSSGQPLRPLIDDSSSDDEVAALMRRCWAEDAADRPDFPALKHTIRKLNKEHDSGNILDNLLSRMEQYANNLEQLVDERTSDYLEEKRKCEELLYQLLPKSVAKQLIVGQSVIAETYEEVTIYFSDIVGFTNLSATSSPMQVVDLLNDLYTCFDSIIEHFDVYKVETIGDAYMVVSGLPVRNGNIHAREIARMALALLGNVHKFTMRHRPDEQLKLRIGMHTGPCVAGVVGLKMPRYCLFGDTVNTASRMESNGAPLRIHVSPTTKEVLDTFGSFDLETRGEVELKGKGKMVTYWLNGERPITTAVTNTTSTPSVTIGNVQLNSKLFSSSVTSSSTLSLLTNNSTDSLNTKPRTVCNAQSNIDVEQSNSFVVSERTRSLCNSNRAHCNQMMTDDVQNASVPLLSVTSVSTSTDRDSEA